ncbi:glutaredoxin family protein [Virgibacillus sp. W0181]|uniref:glutaredoxin family protein n=1 Tax=Virgibacillus sp. W0181 TaxID=3391581 RepID=UPI003F48C440
MANKEATVYVSENCQECTALLKHLDEWDVSYNTINVSADKEKMRALQAMNVYGTPATFIEGHKHPVLGFQKNKLKNVLNVV